MPMTWVPFVLLVGFLGAAAVIDLVARRIPNALILSGLVSAMGWHLLGSDGAWSFDTLRPGATGVTGWLFGASVLLAAFLPLYALGIMGAGDVKLLMLVGAIFGARPQSWSHLVGVALSVLAAGGVLAVARALISGSGKAVCSNIRVMLAGYAAKAGGLPGPSFDAAAQSADRMPYALAIGAGALFYAVGKWTGWIRIL